MTTANRRRLAALALTILLGQGVVAALAAPQDAREASADRQPAPAASVRSVPAVSGDSISVPSSDSAAFHPAALDTAAYLRAFSDTTVGDSVGESRLYVSWGAPYGMPGARANVNFTCGDTSEVDTLYLSFETGRDVPRFYVMMAYVNILPAAGDSLGPFWDYSGGGGNQGGLKIQVAPDGTFPCSQPFLRQGIGIPNYDFTPAHGRLFVAYAVRMQDSGPVLADTRYCFARLLFEQKRCRLPGASQPVCIEWEKAEYTPGPKDLTIERGPARFVSVNSPAGSVCAPYRAVARPRRWLPSPTAPVTPALHLRQVQPDSTRH